jgi:hypothetical protein
MKRTRIRKSESVLPMKNPFLFITTKATRLRKRTIKRIVTENGIVELSIPRVGLSRSRSR